MAGPWEAYQSSAEGPWTDYQPQSSATDSLARGTGLGARAIIKSALALPEIAMNAGIGIGNLINRGTNAIGLTDAAQFPSASELTDRALDKFLPAPANTGERLASDVLGAATGAGGIARFAENQAAKAAPGVEQRVLEAMSKGPASQTVAAAAGGGAAGVTREMGGGPIAQLFAALTGGFAPSLIQGAGSAAVRGAVRGGEAGRQQYADRLQAFEDAGTTPSVGQASGSRAAQQVESGLSNVSSSAGIMDRAAEREAREIGAKVEALANNYLPSANATKAGLTIEKGLKGFVDRFKAEQNFLYDKVDQYIPPDTLVPASNVQAKLSELTASIPGAERTSGLMQTPKMGAIGEAVATDAAAKPAQNILSNILGANGQPIITGQTAAQPGGIPYQALKELRSAIGAKITNPSLTDDIPTGQWKQLYGALSEDMSAAANAAGPDAGRAFNRANWFTRAGHDRIDSVLNRVAGTETTTAERVFHAAVNPSEMRDGATTVRTVMKSLAPEERRSVTAAVVKRMGIATPGNQNDLGEQFSSQTFLTNWNKISPEAKASLFSDGEMRANLDQVAKAASIMRTGSKVFANPSGTSPAINNQLTGFSLAGSALTGHFGVTASIAALLAGANASARLMTNPSFVKWLAKTTTMPESMIPTQINMLTQYADKHWPEADRAELANYVRGVNAPAQQQ